VYVSTHLSAVSLCPAAHASEWSDDRLSSWAKEYSTAMAFVPVTRLGINPVDSRLRRVLVSMRCETLPRWQRNSRVDEAALSAKNKILNVHLPIKIGEGIFDSCRVFIMSP
jgi:hypothetical protein